jgi:cysteine desulfurase / selenocysteine lyase
MLLSFFNYTLYVADASITTMISSLSDRSIYTSLEHSNYLNQASLGLLSTPTVRAMHGYLDDIGRHGNMFLTDAEELGLLAPLRNRASTILNCRPAELAIVGSAGEMLSQLPYLLQPDQGKKIIAASTDFPAITRPWIAYAKHQDIEIQFVDDTADVDLTDSLIDAIDNRTAVVIVSYVQFSTGSQVNCSRLRDATNTVGARLVVDVTQAAGAIPIDAMAWRPDVMVCSGYKWLGGHGGVGLAVIAPELLTATPPLPGWMGAEDPFDMQATRLPLAIGARRYTQSTMSYVSIIGLGVAIEELLALGPQKIRSHATGLKNLLLHELVGTGWTPYRSADDHSASSHIVSLSHPRSESSETLRQLLSAKIICSVRNGRVRVSLSHFNESADIYAIVKTLKQITGDRQN